MFSIFLFVPILIFMAGMLLLILKILPNLGKILIMVSASGCGLAGLFFALVGLLDSAHAEFYLLMLMIFEFLLLVLLGLFLWGGIKKKILSIPVYSLIAGCLIVTVGFTFYQRYVEQLPVMGENSDLLTQYSPFKQESKVATLEEPSTLTLTGDLPKMDGATALYPIYSSIFKATYGAKYIDCITCTTTTDAYKSIVDGGCDIIFVGGPSAEQEQYAKDNGVELVYTPIGKEAFVFFVNAKNPLENIMVEQVRSIYSGETTKWTDLGVRGLGEIRAFQRDEGSGSQSALIRLMGDVPLMDPPTEDVMMGMGMIITETADYKNHKNALGYSFRFYSTEMVQNDQIKLLKMNGVEPTLENIENGTYPVASSFYAVTRSDCSENTQKLVDWILTDQGQELIEKTGYTPIK